MLPAVGSRNLVSRLKTVVLPAPFGPIKAWMVPRRTARSTPRTAVNPRNSFVSPLVSRISSVNLSTLIAAPDALPVAIVRPSANLPSHEDNLTDKRKNRHGLLCRPVEEGYRLACSARTASTSEIVKPNRHGSAEILLRTGCCEPVIPLLQLLTKRLCASDNENL